MEWKTQRFSATPANRRVFPPIQLRTQPDGIEIRSIQHAFCRVFGRIGPDARSTNHKRNLGELVDGQQQRPRRVGAASAGRGADGGAGNYRYKQGVCDYEVYGRRPAASCAPARGEAAGDTGVLQLWLTGGGRGRMRRMCIERSAAEERERGRSRGLLVGLLVSLSWSSGSPHTFARGCLLCSVCA